MFLIFLALNLSGCRCEKQSALGLVNHQQSFHIPLSTLPVWKLGIPWQLSKQINKLFFQIYSIPDQTDGRICKRRKTSLEWKINLCSKLSLTCGSNVNYYNSVHHPITTCGKSREHPGNTYNILESSFQLSVLVYSLLVNLKRKGRPFLEGTYKKGGHIVRPLCCHKR